VGMDHVLVFRLSQRALGFILDGRFRFTRDGEHGMTSLQEAWGVESCDSRGGQVDGEAAVVAEAFEVGKASVPLG